MKRRVEDEMTPREEIAMLKRLLRQTKKNCKTYRERCGQQDMIIQQLRALNDIYGRRIQAMERDFEQRESDLCDLLREEMSQKHKVKRELALLKTIYEQESV